MISSGTKGNIALGNAIAYFTKLGYTVAIPLTDTQKYDLIVDIDGILKKVQCKYTSIKDKGVTFILDLRVRGHIDSKGVYYSKNFEEDSADFIYALTSEGQTFLIPTEDLKGRQSISLGKKAINYSTI